MKVPPVLPSLIFLQGVITTGGVCAEDFSDTVAELSSCTPAIGFVRRVDAAYTSEQGGILTIKIETFEGVEFVAVKMENADFTFDGTNISVDCQKPACVDKMLFSGWPHSLRWKGNLSVYKFFGCEPDSQERIFRALEDKR